MRRRLLTGLAFLVVLAASTTPALAADGFTLTPRAGDQFPARTYLLTLPPGKTAGTGTLHVTENGEPCRRTDGYAADRHVRARCRPHHRRQ